jgi:hypothetical protein
METVCGFNRFAAFRVVPLHLNWLQKMPENIATPSVMAEVSRGGTYRCHNHAMALSPKRRLTAEDPSTAAEILPIIFAPNFIAIGRRPQ